MSERGYPRSRTDGGAQEGINPGIVAIEGNFTDPIAVLYFSPGTYIL